MMEGYEPHKTRNADETRVYFQSLVDKIITLKEKQASRRKKLILIIKNLISHD